MLPQYAGPEHSQQQIANNYLVPPTNMAGLIFWRNIETLTRLVGDVLATALAKSIIAKFDSPWTTFRRIQITRSPS